MEYEIIKGLSVIGTSRLVIAKDWIKSVPVDKMNSGDAIKLETHIPDSLSKKSIFQKYYCRLRHLGMKGVFSLRWIGDDLYMIKKQ